MTRREENARAALAVAGIEYPAARVLRAAGELAGCIEDEAGARECREAREALRLAIAESGDAESDADADERAGTVAAELHELTPQRGAWDARRSDAR